MTERREILVTESNHNWVAENSGYSLEEVKAAYAEAQAKDLVCVILEKMPEEL